MKVSFWLTGASVSAGASVLVSSAGGTSVAVADPPHADNNMLSTINRLNANTVVFFISSPKSF